MGLRAGGSLFLLWKWAFWYPFQEELPPLTSEARAVPWTVELQKLCVRACKGWKPPCCALVPGNFPPLPLASTLKTTGRPRADPMTRVWPEAANMGPRPGRRPWGLLGSHFFFSVIQQLLPYLGCLDSLILPCLGWFSPSFGPTFHLLFSDLSLGSSRLLLSL